MLRSACFKSGEDAHQVPETEMRSCPSCPALLETLAAELCTLPKFPAAGIPPTKILPNTSKFSWKFHTVQTGRKICHTAGKLLLNLALLFKVGFPSSGNNY